MAVKTGLRLVEMVDNPYDFYHEEAFQNAKACDVFSAMIKDPHHLMRIDNSQQSFFGGYILGYTLRERMGTSEAIEQKPKSYSHLDPIRFCQSMEMFCDELPESIEPEKQKPKLLVERFDMDGNLEYRIYVGNLAYLSIPTVKTGKISNMDLKELIRMHRMTRDETYQKEFGTRTEELIKKLIMKKYLSALLASGGDIGSFENAGRSGAEEVFECFDLTKPVRVETYFPYRVGGAMLDELRKLDKVSRLTRTVMKQIQPLIQDAKTKGKELSVEGLVVLTGREKDTVQQAYDLIEGIGEELSLDKPIYENDSHREILLSDLVGPSESTRRGRRNQGLLSSKDGVARVDNKDFLSHILSCLSQQDQEIIVGYHLHGLTMKEVGAGLGLSESRVSQMHSRIWEDLKRLASRMKADWVEK